RRNTRSATSTARATARAAHLCHRAGWPYGREKLPYADRAPRRAGKDGVSNSPTHAATRLRLRPGQCRPRHASAAGVAWSPQYSAHGALYGNGTEPVSRFLAGLKTHFGMSADRGAPDITDAVR